MHSTRESPEVDRRHQGRVIAGIHPVSGGWLSRWQRRCVSADPGRYFMIVVRISAPLAACAMLLCGVPAYAQQANMSFFVTSVGAGKGADLGGLAGADRHCQQLASAVGAGGKTWHAYLSTQGAGAVNARDRIGKGPWVNAKGITI